jgi:hypothetical protein
MAGRAKVEILAFSESILKLTKISFTLGILGPPATAIHERRGQFARVSLLEQAK